MYKITLLLLFCFGTSLATSAQKAAPATISSEFKKRFPAAMALQWAQVNTGMWQAQFRLNGVQTSANYSSKGEWLETESVIHRADLPAPVSAALKGKKIKGVSQVLLADGSTVYEAMMKRKELRLDDKGVMLE